MSEKGKVYVVCAIDAEGPIDNPKKPDILNSWEKVWSLVNHLLLGAYSSLHAPKPMLR